MVVVEPGKSAPPPHSITGRPRRHRRRSDSGDQAASTSTSTRSPSTSAWRRTSVLSRAGGSAHSRHRYHAACRIPGPGPDGRPGGPGRAGRPGDVDGEEAGPATWRPWAPGRRRGANARPRRAPPARRPRPPGRPQGRPPHRPGSTAPVVAGHQTAGHGGHVAEAHPLGPSGARPWLVIEVQTRARPAGAARPRPRSPSAPAPGAGRSRSRRRRPRSAAPGRAGPPGSPGRARPSAWAVHEVEEGRGPAGAVGRANDSTLIAWAPAADRSCPHSGPAQREERSTPARPRWPRAAPRSPAGSGTDGRSNAGAAGGPTEPSAAMGRPSSAARASRAAAPMRRRPPTAGQGSSPREVRAQPGRERGDVLGRARATASQPSAARTRRCAPTADRPVTGQVRPGRPARRGGRARRPWPVRRSAGPARPPRVHRSIRARPAETGSVRFPVSSMAPLSAHALPRRPRPDPATGGGRAASWSPVTSCHPLSCLIRLRVGGAGVLALRRQTLSDPGWPRRGHRARWLGAPSRGRGPADLAALHCRRRGPGARRRPPLADVTEEEGVASADDIVRWSSATRWRPPPSVLCLRQAPSPLGRRPGGGVGHPPPRPGWPRVRSGGGPPARFGGKAKREGKCCCQRWNATATSSSRSP